MLPVGRQKKKEEFKMSEEINKEKQELNLEELEEVAGGLTRLTCPQCKSTYIVSGGSANCPYCGPRRPAPMFSINRKPVR